VYKISPTELAVVIHGQSHSDNQTWFRDKPNLEFWKKTGIWCVACHYHDNSCTIQYSDSDICCSLHRFSEKRFHVYHGWCTLYQQCYLIMGHELYWVLLFECLFNHQGHKVEAFDIQWINVPKLSFTGVLVAQCLIFEVGHIHEKNICNAHMVRTLVKLTSSAWEWELINYT